MSWRFGGAKVSNVGGGGGDPFYGPLPTPDAVRTEAVPLAVVHPGGSPTVVNPGDNIATKIATAGAGGTLWFVKGTHVLTSRTTPLTGQTFVFESAPGYDRTAADSAIIDGQNANFEAFFMTGNDNLTFRGGVFMRQGNASGDAVTWHAPIVPEVGSADWLFEDCIFKDNRNRGANLAGGNSIARRVYSTGNGRYGANGGKTWENCRISFNNTRNLDIGADAGGTKFATGGASDFTIRRCWLEGNIGSGIWLDGALGGHVIEENVCENNQNWGIFYELSRGNTSIYRNYLKNNGVTDPGNSWFRSVELLVSCSDGTLTPGDISISRNEIDTTERAMGLINHPSHPTDSRRVQFFENRVWLRNTAGFGGEGGQVGGQDTQTTKTLFTDVTNAFYANEYRVASGSFAYWKWGGAGVGAVIDWSAWLALGLNRGFAADTRVLI